LGDGCSSGTHLPRYGPSGLRAAQPPHDLLKVRPDQCASGGGPRPSGPRFLLVILTQLGRRVFNLNQVRERNGRPDCLVIVPIFHLRVGNSDFESTNEIEASDFGGAQRQALRAALQIGTDEVCKGASFFGAEVRIVSDGAVTKRFVVGIGQSPLK